MIPHLKHASVWFWKLEKKRIESNPRRSTGIIPTVARIELHHYDWFLLISPTPAMSAENEYSFTAPRMCSLRARLRSRQLAILSDSWWFFWILLMHAAFKRLESISKILLNQADSPYDFEKSFVESLILNRLWVWKIIDSSSERPLGLDTSLSKRKILDVIFYTIFRDFVLIALLI